MILFVFQLRTVKPIGFLIINICITLVYLPMKAQVAKSVLFLGNSYTYVNNLPQLLSDVAAAMGDSVYFDISAPGGYTLQGHTTNATSLGKIALGNWDVVVLQEQSQRPSFPDAQVAVEVFPYARQLDSLIRSANPCAETMFFMTWGRKNGDAGNCAFWPPVCTYDGMDSLLNLRYRMMADSNDAVVSPVGAVWNYLRKNHPSIELYDPDGSHPSIAGSIAAAYCFYTSVFRKSPLSCTFNGPLSVSDANVIRFAVHDVVYDSLSTWFIGDYDPLAGFYYTASGNTLTFTNTSMNSTAYHWDFGDGTSSSAFSDSHTYAASGTYTVTLIASHCGLTDTASELIQVLPASLQEPVAHPSVTVFPNPASDYTIVRFDAMSYIELFDLTGKKQSVNIQYDRSSALIDLSGLESGYYFVSIQNHSGKRVFKILVN